MTSVQASAAQHYLKNSLLQKDHSAELMNMLTVPCGGLVLDLGCGTGHLATVLSDLVGSEGQVVAVDPDTERIVIAKRENSRPNVEYIIANDETFPGEEYNLIVSTDVIHWIKNKQALFNHLYRKLAPGGIFGFVTFDSAPKFSSILDKALSELISPDFHAKLSARVKFENKETYATLATAAGFEVTSFKVVPEEQSFTSLDELLGYFSGLSHGSFDIKDVDKKKLQNFKENHGKALTSAVIKLDTLCMVVERN